MSKTKQKTHSKAEHLEGQVKALKSQNRQLRKRLKELERKSHFYEDLVDEVVEEVKIKDICPKCKTGVLTSHDFTHIVVTKCNNPECDYQKRRKPRNVKAK